VTAPYKRVGTEDQVGAHHRRIRTLEANRSQPDAYSFNWAENSINANEPDKVVSVGGTDPAGVGLYSTGYVCDNLAVMCGCHIFPIGGFSAGTGSQYLIPLGQSVLYQPYLPYFPLIFGQALYPDGQSVNSQVLGVMVAYDDTAATYTTMYLRASAIDYLGDGSIYVEAYDPTSGNLWGPTFPYTWAADDIMLSGNFTYTLASSLTDTVGS
jgi:hypothetical protein